jgi:hypothetical protein
MGLEPRTHWFDQNLAKPPNRLGYANLLFNGNLNDLLMTRIHGHAWCSTELTLDLFNAL